MRSIPALLFVVLALAIALVVADNPGSVAVTWHEYRIDTSLAVLAVAALALGALGAVLLYLLVKLVTGPRSYLRRRRERRRRDGYRALTQGMVAVAAGDAEEAQRYARKADVLLAEPPLTLLLSAQAAQLNGDEAAARKYFSAMLDRPETEFLGLRGLLMQALRDRDEAAALKLAERARSLRPKAGWALTTLLDLQARAGRWDEAETTLLEAVRRKALPEPESRHERAVLLYERSRQAASQGHDREAMSLAVKAQRLEPGFSPAAVWLAGLLRTEGQARQSAKVIESGWREAPHPALAQAYAETFAGEAPLGRVKQFEQLAALNPDHPESHIALATAALEARLWGEVRRHLEALGLGAASRDGMGRDGTADPSPRLCRLMAELEEAERGDPAAARPWLTRTAVTTTPDPTYVCGNCGAESPIWTAICGHCRGFATLRWQTPPRAAVALSPPGGAAVTPSTAPMTLTRPVEAAALTTAAARR